MNRTRWNDDLETWCDERYYRKDEVDEMISQLELNSGLVFSVEVEDEIFSVDDGVQEFKANLSWSNGTGVDGKGVLFSLVDGNGNIVDTSLVTTDVDGYAVYEYTPTGRGQFFVTASYGTLLQETFVVYDVIKFDNATSTDHNDNVWASATNITRNDEYSTIGQSGSTVIIYSSITGDICIECDVRTNTFTNGTVIRILEDSSTILSDLTRQVLNMNQNEWKHIKLTISDNKLTVDGTSIVDEDITGYNRFYFRSNSGYNIDFKNFKVYSA